MTPQEEAIKWFEEEAQRLPDDSSNKSLLKVAIEALQYRTRKIPIVSCPDFMCPKCMTYGIEDLDREKLDYCPNCGQAIDWRDVK